MESWEERKNSILEGFKEKHLKRPIREQPVLSYKAMDYL